jgi:hypothetical protein
MENIATTHVPEDAAEYARIAEGFITLLDFNQAHAPGLLDGSEVANAINDHLVALHNELDWFDPVLLREMYAPLRAHLNRQKAERAAAYERYRRERLGKTVTLTPAKSRYSVLAGDKLTGVVTDKVLPNTPMAITRDGDAWIGQVTQTSETHCEIETVHGKASFRFDEIELIAFDWPQHADEAPHKRAA